MLPYYKKCGFWRFLGWKWKTVLPVQIIGCQANEESDKLCFKIAISTDLHKHLCLIKNSKIMFARKIWWGELSEFWVSELTKPVTKLLSLDGWITHKITFNTHPDSTLLLEITWNLWSCYHFIMIQVLTQLHIELCSNILQTLFTIYCCVTDGVQPSYMSSKNHRSSQIISEQVMGVVKQSKQTLWPHYVWNPMRCITQQIISVLSLATDAIEN